MQKKILFYCAVFIAMGLFLEGAVRLHHLFKYNFFKSKFSSYNWVVYEAYEPQDKDKVDKSARDRQRVKFVPHPFLLYMPEPSQRLETIYINTQGFRAPDINFDNKQAYRIFLLGGSAVFGSGALSNDRTIAGYMQEMLGKLLPDRGIEVINAGIDGYASNQERILFEEYIIGKADMVVVLDGANDIWGPTVLGQGMVGYPYEFLTYKDIIKNPLGSVFKKMLEKSMLYEKISRRFATLAVRAARRPQHDYSDDSMIGAVKENYFKNIEIIHILAGQNGIEAFFFLQPMIFVDKKTLTASERAIRDREINWGYMIDDARGYFTNSYQKIIDGMQGLSAQGIHAYSLTGVFEREKGAIYIDAVHFGDRGHKIIAEAIVKIIYPFLDKSR